HGRLGEEGSEESWHGDLTKRTEWVLCTCLSVRVRRGAREGVRLVNKRRRPHSGTPHCPGPHHRPPPSLPPLPRPPFPPSRPVTPAGGRVTPPARVPHSPPPAPPAPALA